MNKSLSLEILQDDFLRDATKRVLGNILTGFDELSGAEYNNLFDINMDFLVNHIPNIADIPYEITVDNFKYKIGRGKFDKEILKDTYSKMEGKWVISVDESIIDQESFIRNVAYRHSLAFGYKISVAQKTPDESVLAVSQFIRLQDDADFGNKMQFIPYLLNLYTTYYAAKILQGRGQAIFAVILHGPLIRMIAPFLKLIFPRDVIKRVVTADTDPPINKITDKFKDEIKTIASGDLIDLITGEEDYKNSVDWLLDLFGSQEERRKIKEKIDEEGQISGICFYFLLLKKLSDLANEMGFYLIGCVERADSEEYSDLYMQYQIESFGQESPQQQKILDELFKTVGVNDFKTLIRKLGWDDEMIKSFSLRFGEHSGESEFTLPVPVRRYFPTGKNEDIFNVKFGSTSYYDIPSQERVLDEIIKTLFPFNNYRMLMSYVRTSELKAPIRVEFLEPVNKDDWHQVLTSIYVFSRPYSSYGLPIFLYYADKMARTPKKIIASVTDRYLVEQVKRTLHNYNLEPANLTQVWLNATKKLRRDFYGRER